MTSFDAGDAGIRLRIRFLLPGIDTLLIDSVRIMVNGPAAGERVVDEIIDVTEGSIRVVHVTTANSFPLPGKYLGQVWVYDAEGNELGYSREQVIVDVGLNRVASPPPLT
jgi:hypothetical protein